MNIMRYKEYAAHVEYSDEDDCFVGHIAGIKDIVGFHADSVKKLHIAFEEAVDDYLATCKKAGKTPQKPYSGHLMLRIPPELHAKIATLAEANRISLNSWAIALFSKVN